VSKLRQNSTCVKRVVVLGILKDERTINRVVRVEIGSRRRLERRQMTGSISWPLESILLDCWIAGLVKAGLLDCSGDWKAVKDVSTACKMSRRTHPSKETGNAGMSGLLF
jgi:hypothetical protein